MTYNNRLITRKEVELRCRIGRSSIYRLMRAGRFPLPIRIGLRAVRWRESEIDDFIATRPLASGEMSQV